MSTYDDFSTWYGEHYRRVLSSVLLATGADRARAEDAVNDAFVSAYEKWERVREFESATGWVTKVAINNAKRSFRVRHRKVRKAHDRATDVSSDPEIDMDLWAAVKQLPTRQREALALRYVEDMSQAEVASQLGVAEGTAAASLNHARKNLKAQLAGDTNDERK
ncbi:MAG: RNA polymerase sigma factor (sigma-70 family) [Verrucomicrobiales bacterium]|jgi:RNA polymerase sigma factor (sigma-70 family)